jgi:hypothetical protein
MLHSTPKTDARQYFFGTAEFMRYFIIPILATEAM